MKLQGTFLGYPDLFPAPSPGSWPFPDAQNPPQNHSLEGSSFPSSRKAGVALPALPTFGLKPFQSLFFPGPGDLLARFSREQRARLSFGPG